MLAAVVTFFIACVAIAATVEEVKRWDDLFGGYAATSVFVLCKGSSASCVTNNKIRADKPFIPASTFKIANAVIALETGVVKDGQQVFKWDGKPRNLDAWEHDFVLRGAIQNSVVPVFQDIARQIGPERMKAFLSDFDYGNGQIGGGIDRFWLDGDLRISAMEQIHFLEGFYAGELPVSERNRLIAKDALTSEAAPGYLIRSKTGFSGLKGKIQPAIAWWVGWVETGAEVYYFAFNMDVVSEDALPARTQIPRAVMRAEGVPIGP